MAVTVYKGTNRRFFLTYHIRGSRFVNEDTLYMTLPLLVGPRGVAYAQGRTNGAYSNSNVAVDTDDIASLFWWWDEAALIAAGIPIGEDTVCYITDIDHQPLALWGTIEEQFWSAGTLKDVRQADGGVASGGTISADNWLVPNSPPTADPDEPTLLNLAFTMMIATNVTIVTFPGYTEVISFDNSDRLQVLIHTAEGEDDASSVTLTTNIAPEVATTTQYRTYSHPVASQTSAGVALGVQRPRMRSIDAKSIADRYNKGQPLKPDYTWPGGRKFYQR